MVLKQMICYGTCSDEVVARRCRYRLGGRADYGPGRGGAGTAWADDGLRGDLMAKDPRWLALIVLCAGTLMIILEGTIVTVALPSIQRDLGFSQSGLAWGVNAYLIAFGGLLLLAGRFGDLVGRKSVFLAGVGVFTAASLVCG